MAGRRKRCDRGRVRQSGGVRLIAGTAICGLLFLALLPLLHRPAALAGPAQGSVSLVVCSPQGLKVVRLPSRPAEGEPDQDSGSGGEYVCPICIGAKICGTGVLPVVAQLAPAFAPAVPLPIVQQRLVRPRHQRTASRPRAPPARI
jgi:hypothetical protein